MIPASRLFFLAACTTGLAACAQGPGHSRFQSRQNALPAMEQIALNANRCWFKSGDRAFQAYRLAPELQSFSGRPRILVVPHDNQAGKPLLVIEATGTPARIEAYGALMHGKTGKRIAGNIQHWAQGGKSC
ncbi:MAG: Hypothetical protein BHV28_10000 [Candidatus Tokpelaia hoelldobleri]|uniref:Lipoprotein n=1 Tax=Candidatus Tokpelaia hoelldobleri TaxID=1902579 RepID=A0A1U9JUY6_9HYPH|nr:MAG: Hypothetical protein BHV28_10000 [Candidatus Tokpelaia hoelldoblerii]